MSLTVDYANTLSANYHKIYSGDWESSIAMDRMGLAYGYWGEALGNAALFGTMGAYAIYGGNGNVYEVSQKDIDLTTGNNLTSMSKTNPLENIEYNPKVVGQMGDPTDLYHAFPSTIDSFGSYGTVSKIVGQDGLVRTQVEINGSVNGVNGAYQYIIEPNGINVNHRLFVVR
jgi:hypothetical protein